LLQWPSQQFGCEDAGADRQQHGKRGADTGHPPTSQSHGLDAFQLGFVHPRTSAPVRAARSAEPHGEFLRWGGQNASLGAGTPWKTHITRRRVLWPDLSRRSAHTPPWPWLPEFGKATLVARHLAE
jgi:hypothetical protein